MALKATLTIRKDILIVAHGPYEAVATVLLVSYLTELPSYDHSLALALLYIGRY